MYYDVYGYGSCILLVLEIRPYVVRTERCRVLRLKRYVRPRTAQCALIIEMYFAPQLIPYNRGTPKSTHTYTLFTLDATESAECINCGGLSTLTIRSRGTRLRTALRHQEVFGSDQASATLLHKRESAVPSPISSVTPSHCSYTQGKARPDMCTTRRTWTNASMDGRRDEREKRREQVS